MKIKKYFDTIHGFIAEAPSRQMAWMLIRNKCHELKKEVPTIDNIIIQCDHKDSYFVYENNRKIYYKRCCDCHSFLKESKDNITYIKFNKL